MSRTETVKALVESLSNEGDTLAYPDHPLVLDGPTLLTRTEKGLTASFVYTRGTRPASAVAEQARVLLSRLAFPPHTAFRAFFSEGLKPVDTHLDLFDYHQVVTSHSLSQPDGDDEANHSVRHAVKYLRAAHFERFAANQLGKFRHLPERMPPSLIEFPRVKAPRYKLVETGSMRLSASVPAGTRALTNNRIQRVAETFTANDYGLGGGVPGLVETAHIMNETPFLSQHYLALPDEFDQERPGQGTSKQLRAAQFAGGWVGKEW